MWYELEKHKPKVGEAVIIWQEGWLRGTAAYYRSDWTFGVKDVKYNPSHWTHFPKPPNT